MHGTTADSIDLFKKPTADKDLVAEFVIKVPPSKPDLADFIDDDEEEDDADDEAEKSRNSFVDDEAEEAADGEEEGDSMNSSDRREMEENEIQVDGISIGSKDTDAEEDDDEDMDSFIVSDGDVDDDENLLDGSGDDLSLSSGTTSPVQSKMPKKARKSHCISDTSASEADEEQEAVEGDDELRNDECLRVDDEEEPPAAAVDDANGRGQTTGDSNTSTKDESSSASPETERVALKTKKFLSRSVLQPSTGGNKNSKAGGDKHNKSLFTQKPEHGDQKIVFSPRPQAKGRKSLKNDSEAAEQRAAATSNAAGEPENGVENDVDMSEAPAPPTASKSAEVEKKAVAKPKAVATQSAILFKGKSRHVYRLKQICKLENPL